MFFQNINLVVVALAGVVGMIVSSAWFSPLLFGNVWKRGVGNTPETENKKSMILSYLVTFIFTVVTAYILAVIFNSIYASSIGNIIFVPFLIWLAFILPISINDYFWGNKPASFVLINSGHTLLVTVIIALVVGLFS